MTCSRDLRIALEDSTICANFGGVRFPLRGTPPHNYFDVDIPPSSYATRARSVRNDRDHVAVRRQTRARDRIRAAIRCRWGMDCDESALAVLSGQLLPSRPKPLFQVWCSRVVEGDARLR